VNILLQEKAVLNSVADPHWFQCGSGSSVVDQCGSGYGSGSRSRVLMNQKLEKKFTAEKKNIFFRSKVAIYLSLGLHNGRLSYSRSLHLSKENIWHFKT
jgi:hypothetical protein